MMYAMCLGNGAGCKYDSTLAFDPATARPTASDSAQAAGSRYLQRFRPTEAFAASRMYCRDSVMLSVT
jgi:hypothetical protein